MLRKDIMEFRIKDYLSDSDSPNLEFEFHTPELTELDQIEILPPAGNPNELFLIEQEDTVDIAKYEPTEFPVEKVEFPFSPRGPPERTNFTGDYNFSVEVKAQDTHRKKYLYSHRLNRVYVDMEQNFSVQFVWDYSRLGAMYVRATTVFADQAQAEKRVERCVQHTHDLKNVNDFNENIVKHVLQSSREIGTLGVFYCGNASLPDSWYSVLVKFSPDGNSASCSHAYKFVCKSSCSTGINRRAIDVVFTLEDRNGHIYGRQTVGARVCSCPRRDMVRDEDIEGVALNGKKRMVPKPPSEVKGKKIKLEVTSNDEDAFTLPPIQIIGTKAAIIGLEVMLSMMEQAASLKRGDQNAVEKYNNSIQSLKTKIAEIKNGTKPASSCKTWGGPQ